MLEKCKWVFYIAYRGITSYMTENKHGSILRSMFSFLKDVKSHIVMLCTLYTTVHNLHIGKLWCVQLVMIKTFGASSWPGHVLDLCWANKDVLFTTTQNGSETFYWYLSKYMHKSCCKQREEHPGDLSILLTCQVITSNDICVFFFFFCTFARNCTALLFSAQLMWIMSTSTQSYHDI